MSKLHTRMIAEDVVNDRCSDAELEALYSAFEYTVKRFATTLARKAWFELSDFATSKQRGIENFSLMIERKTTDGQDMYFGTFKDCHKNLRILASLEK